MARPLILVTNDDGFHAPGLQALAETLSERAEVFVVAPHIERSGAGQGLTLTYPLRAQKLGERAWAVEGTPTDCVLFALHHLLDRKPDWVFSGINRGSNVGQDVFYSGTVAGAMEGCLNGIPAVAVSLNWSGHDTRGDYEPACQIVRMLYDTPGALEPARDAVLNINVPRAERGKIKGFAVATLGRRIYESRFHENVDPRGRPYYWLGGGGREHVDIPGSDCNLLNEGYVTLTVLKPDLCDRHGNARLETEVVGELNRTMELLT